MIFLFAFISFLFCVCMNEPTLISMGVSQDCLWNALIYQFAHTKFLHWGINTISLALMFEPIRNLYSLRFRYTSPFVFFHVVYLGSVLAGLFGAIDMPTIGASGMVYFLLGMLIILNPTLKQLKAYVYVALALIIGVFFGKSNVLLHIIAFILGALFIIIRNIISGNWKIHRGEQTT